MVVKKRYKTSKNTKKSLKVLKKILSGSLMYIRGVFIENFDALPENIFFCKYSWHTNLFLIITNLKKYSKHSYKLISVRVNLYNILEQHKKQLLLNINSAFFVLCFLCIISKLH